MSTEEERLVARIAGGDREALGPLLERYRDRLRRMVALRLEGRMSRRLDASDVVQDACLEAAQRFDDFARDDMTPYVRIRLIAAQKLAQAFRTHLGVQGRDMRREATLPAGPVSSVRLAFEMTDGRTRPDAGAERAELGERLQRALDAMDPLDREIVAMRHFERMTSREVGQALGLTRDAASKRYARALARIRDLAGLDDQGF